MQKSVGGYQVDSAGMRGHLGIIGIAGCLVCCVWMCFGCQNTAIKQGKTDGALPAEVAGVWKAKGSAWKIVLGTDGTVRSAVIPMGQVEIRPNQVTKVEMQDGSWSTFEAGDCVVQYNPQSRELYVSIEMKRVHIQYMDNVIEGNSVDRFIGPVSEDGKTWMADWITVFDYGPRFPQDPNDVAAEPLIFEKLEEPQPQQQ